MRYRLSLAALAGLLFLSAFAVSLGILGPTVTSIRARHLLRRQYGVSTPDEFTQLTGLTLKGTSSIDFTTLTSSICGFNLVSLALVSYLGGRLKRRITRPVAVALLFMFLLGFVSGVQVARAATPTYTIEPAGLLPKAYDYIIYKSGGTYYRINGTTSTATSGTDDDAIIQAALNQSKSVIIKAGSYLATVTVKGGRLVIEKGATGVTYSIQTGATCVVEDWNDGETKYYSAGTLTLRLDHASGAVYAGEYHLDGDNVTEVLQYPYQPTSYIIFKSGSKILAKSGVDGEIKASGTDASTVIQSAINSASSGDRIYIVDDLTITKRINVTKTLLIESERRTLTTSSDITMFYVTAYDVLFRNIKLICTHTTPTGSGIWIYDVDNVHTENIIIDGFKYGILAQAVSATRSGFVDVGSIIYGQRNGGAGIYFKNGYGGSKLVGTHLSGTPSRLSQYGVLAQNATNYLEFIGIHVDDTVWDGILLDGGTGSEIKHVKIVADIERAGRHGIHLYKVKHFDVIAEIESEGYTSNENGFEISSCHFGTIQGSVFSHGRHGVHVVDSTNITVVGINVRDVSTTSTGTYDAFNIQNSKGISVLGGSAIDEGAITHQRALTEWGTSDNNVIIGLSVHGVTTPPIISIMGTNTKVRNCLGFVTENWGTTTLLNGTTSVTVSHGLDVTPEVVTVTPSSSLGLASEFWVSTVTATSFVINVDANPNRDVTFYWRAEAS